MRVELRPGLSLELGQRLLGGHPRLVAVTPCHGFVGAGDAIPLEARILHVADAYEAMTRGHSYQMRMTAEEALTELDRLAGSQFDPQCVSALRASTAIAQAA